MISREEALSKLKKTWRTKELKFYAEFFRPKKEDGSLIKPRPGVNAFGFFINLSINDRKIFYPSDEALKYERNVSFKVDAVNGLEDGKYYYLELELEDDEKRVANPYALKIKNILILEEDHLSPKEFINQWFYKKGHTPGDASTIAGQLTLNELELYTHTKRFIFELIQNADDMPDGSKGVQIEINLLPNHLLFLHNGKYFDREDVKAISDAAKSTKAKSLSQTGYKGIGFKSVFTDSTRVYIKSGDYFFKFDKLEPIYKDFYRLYKGYSESLTPKARKEFEMEYKGREQEYTHIDKIPWQIKPIWVESNSIPHELSASPFAKNRQVSIALEINENILRQKNYHGMILGLLREPRFLLFLRNTKGFKYNKISDQGSESFTDISVREKNDIISVYSSEEIIASYIKHAFTISITNDDFIKAGLNFQKREIEGDKIEFFDNNGNKLDNIPEKLGRLDKTIITLSAKIEHYAIEKLDKEDSILFNYLPTSDQRFGFPFLVNADFVSKTDREFIQIENKWNHYLFYHLGQKCIEWIAILAGVTHEFQGKKLFSYAKTYLNLLPDELLDEDNEELSSINIAFNNGLNDAIKSNPFIIDSSSNIQKCDDIIIDETLISKVLGAPFFKVISKTKKELPFFLLDVQRLKKKYLNIEKYNAKTLIRELSEEANKPILIETIKRLKPEIYLEFLAWLDTFCDKNDVNNDWILDLEIIRLGDSIISLRESLTKADFFLRIASTAELESILRKTGFTLSEFNIDDDNLKHIKAIVLQQDSYLKTDLKLYDHITASPDLGKLTADEKNTLITFFESLDEVGKAKYAKSLALFKSKKKDGSLKPLNSLISNSCVELPTWLSDFVIDGKEEDALSTIFQGQLLKEKDLLEKLFCNLETYNEIIVNINADNIAIFYAYILKLLNAKPASTNIDFSAVPWVFVEASSTFALASSVYWPESITKLADSKYASVKLIMETISDEQLPHFEALQIKAPLALGGKEIKLSELIPKENSFDVIAINDFLDWAATNLEKDFFKWFIITKNNERFTILQSAGKLHYYSPNEELNKLISNNPISENIVLFPSDLYSASRSSIGVLEKNDLIIHLLKNGFNQVNFVKFITPINDDNLKKLFLSQLAKIELSSIVTYDKKTDEHQIFETILKLGEIDQAVYNGLVDKILIDGQVIGKKNISDIVFFDYKTNILVGQKQFTLKLSQILPNYKNETAALTAVIENFIDIKSKKDLRTKILKSTIKNKVEIFNEIHELNEKFITPYQMFFLILYNFEHPDIDVRKNRLDFDDYWISLDEKMHAKLCIEMINLFFNHNFTKYPSRFGFNHFDVPYIIYDNNYALPTEKIPTWVSKWLAGNKKLEKEDFLKNSGLNYEDSPVVILRKGILENNEDLFNKGLSILNNEELLKNTLYWLKHLKSKSKHIYSKKYLQPVYTKLRQLSTEFKTLPVPVLKNYSSESYTLIDNTPYLSYHIKNEKWGEYAIEIFSSITKLGHFVLDDLLPISYVNLLKPTNVGANSVFNYNLISEKSYEYSEDYYKEWKYRNTHRIFIYDGSELPQIIRYSNIFSKTVFSGKTFKFEQKYFNTADEENDLPYSIKDILPENIYRDLITAKSEFERNKKKEEHIIKYTDEEASALKRLFGNEIPSQFYKDLNLAALITALIYLSKNGYDISKAEKNLRHSHKYGQLFPVYRINGTVRFLVMARSARAGLLYLTAHAWNKLTDPHILLFVTTGDHESNHHLFKGKQDILKISDTNFQVFRVEAESKYENIDNILNGKFDKTKIWLILKMKETETYKSIFEGGIKRNEENPDYANVNISENSPY